MPESKQEKCTTVLLMFKYRGHGAKRAEVINIFDVVERGDSGRYVSTDTERVYSRKVKGILRNPSSGMVFEVDTNKDESIYSGTARYDGRLSDTKKVTEWQALDQARRDEIDSEKALRKDQKRDFVLESLEPIRRAYSQMRGAQRTVFLARVVRHITGQKGG